MKQIPKWSQILGWVIGALFLIGAINDLADGNFATATIAAITGVALIPQVRVFVYERTGVELPLWGRAILLTGLILMIGVLQTDDFEAPFALRTSGPVGEPQVEITDAPAVYAQVDCADWSTGAFFEAAEISDVTRCLQAGANPGARYEGGFTPLHMAVFAGLVEAVTALLQAGADLEARESGGSTPLHRAAQAGYVEVVTALLRAGADLKARSEGGLTPLHLAGNAEVVTALLRAGADPKALTTAGKLPFDLIKDDAQLKETDGYWKLNQARFE